jgi:hypothetical protein
VTRLYPQVTVPLRATSLDHVGHVASIEMDLDSKITLRAPPIESITDVYKGAAVSFLSAFAASFGSMLLMAALIASWIFRSSSAPLIVKMTVPTLIVVLACATPYQVNTMLGFPISAPPATMPTHAELVAFVLEDGEARVDLWLRQGDAPPRAYETTLDDKLRQTLREAQGRLGHGERVLLVKARLDAKRTRASEQRAPNDPGYELDDSAFSLPPKG